jgi:predicted Rossmann fold flavoprotein
MLFTHRGISGPAILQISSYWNPGDAVTINLMPKHDAASHLLNLKNESPKSLLRTVLTRDLPKALTAGLEALWWPNQSESPLADWENSKIKSIGALLNGWMVKPSSTEGYRTAEVTLGGVNTDAIKSKSMECKEFPKLFFIGEVLDVTGHLGGFNFQWAWSSGYVAGLHV